MRLLLITVALLVVALPTTAAEKNGILHTLDDDTSSGWFLSSQSRGAGQFDLWQIDSGYTYSITDNTAVYLSTRLKSGNDSQSASRGLLSGVKYAFSPRLSLHSAVSSEINDKDTVLSVEVSSQYELTEQFNVHATMDYESLEQVYQFGIGFKF